MAKTQRRSRRISFRIAEEDVAKFLAHCEANGARSLSDMARRAVWQVASDSAPSHHENGHLERQLAQACIRLDNIERDLRQFLPNRFDRRGVR